MTGYGHASAPVDRGPPGTRVTVEIRATNHRGFDLKIRSDEPDAYCDAEITRALRNVVERGAVTVGVHGDRPVGGGLDVDRIRDTHAALDRIRREVGLVNRSNLAPQGVSIDRPWSLGYTASRGGSSSSRVRGRACPCSSNGPARARASSRPGCPLHHFQTSRRSSSPR